MSETPTPQSTSKKSSARCNRESSLLKPNASTINFIRQFARSCRPLPLPDCTLSTIIAN